MTAAPTILPPPRSSFAAPRNRLADATIIERNDYVPFDVIGSSNVVLTRLPLAGWFKDVFGELEQLLQLPKGWDSNGAEPPEEPMTLAALEIATSLAQVEWTRPSVVTATRSGGIQFEWGSHDAAYFELECVDRNTAEYYFCDKRTGIEKEGTVRSGDSLADVVFFILRTRQFS